MSSDAEKKAWLIVWAIETDNKPDGIKRIPDQYLTTIGAMARMISRGFPVRPDTLIGIIDRINILSLQFKDNVIEVKRERSKSKISERVCKVMDSYDIMIDNTIDGATNLSFPSLIEMSNANLNQLIKHYQHELDEGGMTAPIVKIYNEILQELRDNKIDMKKAVIPKPRKKRVLTNEQQVKQLNFLDVSNEYELSSINPQTIIGAKLFLAFNCKTRHLQVYNVADEERGIQCKGTTLQNIDKERSLSKLIRNPKKELESFKSGNREKANSDFNTLSTSPKKLSGRLTKDCILLKVFYK